MYNNTPPDPPSRLLALQLGGGVAMAYGKRLSVVPSGASAPADLGAAAEHGAPVRALAFDPTGAWLLSADDTKTVRLWRTADWTVAHTFKTVKKPTCAAFSLDGSHAFVGDKFGDVVVGATASGASAPLLGHYCSTISSMAVSLDGRLLATADRDNKVRVSLLPADPIKGAHEIHSYCLGHVAFVTSVAFVRGDDAATGVVTASGDGSIRLWDHLSGEQLAMVQLTQPPEDGAAAAADGEAAGDAEANGSAAAPQSDGTPPQSAVQPGTAGGSSAGGPSAAAGGEAAGAAVAAAGAAPAQQSDAADEAAAAADEEAEQAESTGPGDQQLRCPAITTLAVSPTNRLVAAAIEGQDAVALLAVSVRIGRNCGCTKGTLLRLKPVAMPQVQLPTSLAFDAEGRLWAAGGPLSGSGVDRLCLSVARPESDAADCQSFVDATEAVGAAVAQAAEACKLSAAEMETTEQLAAAGGQLGAHMKKKVYRPEEIEGRKRNRTDVLLKNAAAAGQVQQQAARPAE